MPLLQLPKSFIVASTCKVMATVFWYADGIVLIDYLKHSSTITGTYYTDLNHLIRKVWAELKKRR